MSKKILFIILAVLVLSSACSGKAETEVSASPTAASIETKVSITPEPTLEPTPESTLTSPECLVSVDKNPVVLTLYGGQEEIRLSQIIAIRFDSSPPTVVYWTASGSSYWLSAARYRPGPGFCILAKEGWLSETFAVEEWPIMSAKEVFTDTFFLDGQSHSIIYSMKSESSLLYPTIIEKTEECATILWDFDEGLGPLASKWNPPAAFMWYSWEEPWTGWVESYLPASQKCCAD